jgi:hypothetical protein
MDLKELGCEVVDWILVSHERGQWRALANTIVNLRVPKRRGISRVVGRLLASQEGLCSIELVNGISLQQFYFNIKFNPSVPYMSPQ